MIEELKLILRSLNKQSSLIRAIEQELIDILESPHDLALFIEKLQKEIRLASDPHGNHRPFYYFYLAIAHETLNKSGKAKESLSNAIEGFRIAGFSLNEALGHWLFTIIHLNQGNHMQAEQACENAIEMITQLIREHNEGAQYSVASEYTKLLMELREILKLIKSLPPVEIERAPDDFPAAPSQVQDQATGTAGREARLAFPIYDGVIRAGTQGNNLSDDDLAYEATIEEISFEGTRHRIFHLRGGSRIRVRPSGQLRWYRVEGDSMNSATPIPILSGDYILVNSSINPSVNDIVVAAVETPESAAERAGVVKRLRRDGLYSESTRTYKPMPLIEVSIRGVVVAVAKPILKQRSLIRLLVDGNINELIPQKIERILRGISSLLGISRGDIELIYISAGSVWITAELPDDQLPVLLAAFAERNIIFDDLNIRHIDTRRPGEIPQIPDIDVENCKDITIEEIRERIVDEPITGAKLLSYYLQSKPEFNSQRDQVDLIRSELIRVTKEMSFGHTPDLDAVWRRNQYRLLEICSQVV